MTTTGRASEPAAASIAVRPQLLAPFGPVTVVAAFDSAIYLADGEARLTAVLTRDAARVPVGCVLAADSRTRPLSGVRQGDRAWIGDGRIELPGLGLRVGRWWDPTPRLAGGPAWNAGVTATRWRDELAIADRAGLAGVAALTTLHSGLSGGDLDLALAAARGLLGLGPGLTPSGDDVLAGALCAVVLLEHPDAAAFAAALVRAAEDRTTWLSAALLREAAAGRPSAELGAALTVLVGGGDPAAALSRLLAVGHTSGAAMTLGLMLGIDAVVVRTRRQEAGGARR